MPVIDLKKPNLHMFKSEKVVLHKNSIKDLEEIKDDKEKLKKSDIELKNQKMLLEKVIEFTKDMTIRIKCHNGEILVIDVQE